MFETLRNIGWSMVFSFIGALVGMALVLGASFLVPRLIDRLTPNIDEQREIARGNSAVAEFYGRVVAAAILGVSIVVAAAVLGGVMAALH
jgi:phosphate/sulfate permease